MGDGAKLVVYAIEFVILILLFVFHAHMIFFAMFGIVALITMVSFDDKPWWMQK